MDVWNCSNLTGSTSLRLAAGVALMALATTFSATPAWSLSEIQREDVPVPEGESAPDLIERKDLPPPLSPEAEDTAPATDEDTAEPEVEAPQAEEDAPQPPTRMPVPLPDPIVSPKTQVPPAASEEATDAEEPIPEVRYDASLLPEPVRRMRERIMEACLSGDIERLRPLINGGEDGTQFSFGEGAGDPVQFLRSVSGDDEGHEILAILYEVLAAGYVQLDEEGVGEMYVWPYFFAVPLDKLDGRQRVELFKLVTAGDYEDMKNYGAYIFYRVAISAEGKWLFFVAGD